MSLLWNDNPIGAPMVNRVAAKSAKASLERVLATELAKEDLDNAELCQGVHLQCPPGHATSVVVVEQRM